MAYPDEIYNIYRGVPFVAVPTQPGKSYHGYPVRGRIDPHIREQLQARAQVEGTLNEFNRWVDKHIAK